MSHRPVLHPGTGPIPGEHYLPTSPDTAQWGWLPTSASDPVLEVSSGASVTVDTLSHEGILPDQGQDPERFFGQYEVQEVLQDAVDVAARAERTGEAPGPHVVTGPIRVEGAKPGDLLRVDIEELTPRVPYGVISNRHGLGALPGEYPQAEGNVSLFSWTGDHEGVEHGFLDAGEGRTVRFPLAPFMGMMGTAPAAAEPLRTQPPGEFGGNMDIKHAVVGTTVYLPVLTEGALFFTGDPHFAQGNGEVALTALEASLRATMRLSVIPGERRGETVGGAVGPVIETPTHWIPSGMDEDLNLAMQNATRSAIEFLHQRLGSRRRWRWRTCRRVRTSRSARWWTESRASTA
ncbi:acetamidase/formamidase family protein [Nesterenkonia pannonica]|uniref:acetamidase/formamidase family protein n=1 Tax=Nesterenkonia pannonica TaxID=1548602 RepID=UPI0021643E12|nr:acetamidase/formamidase family protein [Nesterenkonia pannonica]